MTSACQTTCRPLPMPGSPSPWPSIPNIGATHPNTYKITLRNRHDTRRLTAISTGGGMIEVLEIDGTPVSMAGDFFVTLVYVTSPGAVLAFLERSATYDAIALRHGTATFIEVAANRFLSEELSAALAARDDVCSSGGSIRSFRSSRGRISPCPSSPAPRCSPTTRSGGCGCGNWRSSTRACAGPSRRPRCSRRCAPSWRSCSTP